MHALGPRAVVLTGGHREQNVDLFFDVRAARPEVLIDGLVLGGVPADADAEFETTVAQLL